MFNTMLGIESFVGSAYTAVTLVGVVLLEAIALYAGYGALTHATSDAILKRVRRQP